MDDFDGTPLGVPLIATPDRARGMMTQKATDLEVIVYVELSYQ